MTTEEGRAPRKEKPGPHPSLGNVREYTTKRHESSVGLDFSLRTILVLVAFAAWIAACVGVIILIGYGVMAGIAAVSGVGYGPLALVGYGIIAVFAIVLGIILVTERKQ